MVKTWPLMRPTTLIYPLCLTSNYAAPHQGISYAQVSIKIRWIKTHIGLNFKKEMKMDFFLNYRNSSYS